MQVLYVCNMAILFLKSIDRQVMYRIGGNQFSWGRLVKAIKRAYNGTFLVY